MLKTNLLSIPVNRKAFPNGEAFSRFLEDDREKTLGHARLLCLIAMILVPLASILDAFVYPEHWGLFLQLRLACVAVLAGVRFSLSTAFARHFYRAYVILIPMVPALFISLMIALANDPGSPYYAGLTLCLMAIGFLFHWTFREGLVASVLTLGLYLVAIFPDLSLTDSIPGAVFNNLFFILLNACVIVCGSYCHHRLRVSEFVSQYEREEANRKWREARDRLEQTEKMAALGQLSAGIIHEINNPINFSTSALYLLDKRLNHSPGNHQEETREIIRDLEDGLKRVSTIVSDLRDFSYPDRGESSDISVLDVVETSLRFLARPLDEAGLTCRVSIDSALTARGNKSRIVQVLVNLIQNAIDAAAPTKEKRIELNAKGDPERPMVMIQIVDHGAGISSEDQKRLFDPFFTTKDPGEGCGLGLSISYRLLQDQGGDLTCQSSPGGPTSFNVFLPDASHRQEENPIQNPPSVPSPLSHDHTPAG